MPGSRVYNQQYQEIYQPEVFAVRRRSYTLLDQPPTRQPTPGTIPADHFSKLFTEQFAASYVTGSHSLRFGAVHQPGEMAAGAAIHARRAAGHLQRPAAERQPQPGQRHAPHSDRSPQLDQERQRACSCRTSGRSTAPRSTPACAGTGSSARSIPEALPGRHLQPGHRPTRTALTARTTSPQDCVGPRHELEGHQPAHRPVVRPVRRRQDRPQGERRAVRERRRPRGRQHHRQQQPARRPSASPTCAPWRDLDGNGSPFDIGRRAADERADATSASTPNFGRNVATHEVTDPAVLEGWGVRGYNTEYTVSAQHELMPRVSVCGGWYRREFGNQTVTVDQRYSTQEQLRRPVLSERSGEPEPAGRRRLSGLRPVRSEAVGRGAEPAAEQPADLLGRTTAAKPTSTQGFDVSIIARPRSGHVRPGRHERTRSASSISATSSTPACCRC